MREFSWMPYELRAGAKNHHQCHSCLQIWGAVDASIDEVIKEKWAGLILFHRRVFNHVVVITHSTDCSTNSLQTLADAEAVAASENFKGTRHGSFSHITDRCTLMILGPAANWVENVNSSCVQLPQCFLSLFLRLCINDGEAGRVFCERWQQRRQGCLRYIHQ